MAIEFPATIELKIDSELEKFSLDFSVCENPDCSCKSAGLHFFEEVHKLGIRKPEFSFVYDYITGIYRDPTGISDVQVENVINIIPESMNNKLKKRHDKLKKEVKKDIQRKIKEEGFVPSESGKRKLGRNELCHCGSGRKYKKCCLDKDIEKFGKAIKMDS